MNIVWHYHLALEFPEEIERLRRTLDGHTVIVAQNREEFSRHIDEADVVVSGPLSADERTRAAALKAHMLPYAGANALPLADYRANGIAVGNSHGNADVVAERALALALAVSGRVVEFHKDLTEGMWHRREGPAQIFDYWTSILRAPVTIVGTGAIGARVARLLTGFECRITGVRRRPVSESEPLPAGFESITTDLAEGLHGASVVFLCVPLSPETRGMIGGAELARMQDAFLVNVSRGEIVSEHDLYQALLSGTIAGAALDTWWQYPKGLTEIQLPSELPFHTLANVVMSPHAASHTRSGKLSQMRQAIENIISFCTDGSLAYPVDLESGY
ncbi:MAG: hydroxyacid dehydrogenase [Spirochaetaceae bacterium]|nr:MAG: hydroxyacid dehydrogenase [Spirochaetaceae bacterium]